MKSAAADRPAPLVLATTLRTHNRPQSPDSQRTHNRRGAGTWRHGMVQRATETSRRARGAPGDQQKQLPTRLAASSCPRSHKWSA